MFYDKGKRELSNVTIMRIVTVINLKIIIDYLASDMLLLSSRTIEKMGLITTLS